MSARISAAKAQQLLDGATLNNGWLTAMDGASVVAVAGYASDDRTIVNDAFADTRLSRGQRARNGELVAAAPQLARTVIALEQHLAAQRELAARAEKRLKRAKSERGTAERKLTRFVKAYCDERALDRNEATRGTPAHKLAERELQNALSYVLGGRRG